MKRKPLLPALLVFFMLMVQGCATISPFDQFAYVQVTSIKVEVLDLMDKSDEPFGDHEKEVSEVNARLFKAVEYEKHRPKNQVTISMWNKLFKVDSTGKMDESSIIPSYWAKWKREGKERAVFIREAKLQVAEGFDLIAELESKKIKPGDSKVNAFINQ